MDEQPQTESKGYGKRPLWQWIVLYGIIAIVVYGLIYYFVFAKKGGYNYGSSNNSQQQYSQSSSSNVATGSTQPEAMVNNNIVMTKTNPTKGNYLTDTKGMALYIFDKDQPNKSSCSGPCLAAWPIFAAPSVAPQNLPANIGVTKSTTGSNMYTWKGMPLYYFASDKQPGDISGDGVGGVWHLAKP